MDPEEGLLNGLPPLPDLPEPVDEPEDENVEKEEKEEEESPRRVGGDLWATKLFFLEFIVPNDFYKEKTKNADLWATYVDLWATFFPKCTVLQK